MFTSNDWFKLCAQILIGVHMLVGLLFVGYGLYVVFLPWGSAEKDIYEALGICMTLFGACFLLVSTFGYESMEIQVNRFGKGWTGRSVIATYTSFLIALFLALVYMYIYGMAWLASIHDNIQTLKADPTASIAYSESEGALSRRFNSLYFNLVYSCEAKLSWFWVYIQDHCPSTLSQNNCEHCESYSISFCIADEATCYSASPVGQNYACPYDVCRAGTLEFLYNFANKYFEIVMYTAGAVTLCIIVLSVPLIRYSQAKKMTIKITEARSADDSARLEDLHHEQAGQQQGSDHGSDDQSYFYSVGEAGELHTSAPEPSRSSAALQALVETSNLSARQSSRSGSPHPDTITHQRSALEDALIASFIELNSSMSEKNNSAAPPISSEAQLEIAIMESIELQAQVKSQDDMDLEIAIIQSVQTSGRGSRKYQSLSTVQEQVQQSRRSTKSSNMRGIKVFNPASPLAGGREKPCFGADTITAGIGKDGGTGSGKGVYSKLYNGSVAADANLESAILQSVLHSSSQEHMM